MNPWNKHDLKVIELDEKIILLKKEFDKENGTDIKDYNQRLNKFLNRKLKKESDLILKEHFFLTLISLIVQNRKIYK